MILLYDTKHILYNSTPFWLTSVLTLKFSHFIVKVKSFGLKDHLQLIKIKLNILLVL